MAVELSEDAFEQFRQRRYEQSFEETRHHRRDTLPAHAFGALRSAILSVHELVAAGSIDYALIELADAIGILDGVDVAYFRRSRPSDPLNTMGARL